MPDTEYDITTLREGTVDSIVEKLGDLSLPQLLSLDQLERETLGDKARSTLLDPLAKEIAKREASAQGAGSAGDTASGSATTPGTEAPQSPATKTYTEDELSAIVAEKERIWQSERDAAFEEIRRLQNAALAQPVATAEVQRAPIAALVIDGDTVAAGLVAYVARCGAHIVFVDNADRPLPDAALSMVEAGPGQFEAISDSVVYLPDIEFPVHGVQTEIAGAFLLDDDLDPIAKAELAVPVRVGGGTPHKLPGRSLYFSRPTNLERNAS